MRICEIREISLLIVVACTRDRETSKRAKRKACTTARYSDRAFVRQRFKLHCELAAAVAAARATGQCGSVLLAWALGGGGPCREKQNGRRPYPGHVPEDVVLCLSQQARIGGDKQV